MQGERSNAAYQGSTTLYPLTSNNTNAMGVGDVVALVAGSITLPAANAAAGTVGANTPIGVAVGFQYTDSVGRRPFVNSQVLPAGAITTLLYTNVFVEVADAPAGRFLVQANGPVSNAQVGLNVDLGGFASADLTARTSRIFAVAADIATTNTLPLRILAIDKDLTNVAGDAFTKIWVSWNANTHSFSQAGSH
jgi:hypothetical protein